MSKPQEDVLLYRPYGNKKGLAESESQNRNQKLSNATSALGECQLLRISYREESSGGQS